MDSVSDTRAALRRRAGRARLPRRRRPGRGAARAARLPYSSVSAPGISEDIALLLAFEKGAELIVAVGTHFNLTEFLERDRAGMSSTFVTRLKVGEILIDAKGVSRLVSRQVGLWPLDPVRSGRARRGRGGDRRLARPAALHRTAQPAHPRPARPRIATSRRMPTYTARKELLAPLEDVWLFLAEPHHLTDWWPGVAGVTPDRRGLAPGARWRLHAPMRPSLLRRPAAGRRSSCSRSSRRCASPGTYRRAPRRRAQARGSRQPPHARRADGQRAVFRRPAPIAPPDGAQPPVRPVPDCREL